MLKPYPWQQAAWQRVNSMLEQQRIPHALLLTGAEGMGLLHFAEAFAQRLLCQQPDASGYACGQCQSCQLFMAKTHPDIKLLEPEEQGKQLRIDQVRELIEFVALKSFSNRVKIAILTPAEAMNRATANALLKTLEEPPEQSMLLLLSHRPERLPITIRSRCQRIEFKPDISEATQQWLKEQGLETDYPVEQLLTLADGGPLKVIDMLEEQTLEKRKQLIQDLCSMSAAGTDPVRLAADWQNLGCEQVIVWLLRLCQDLVRLKLLEDRASIHNEDLRDELVELEQGRDVTGLLRLYSFLQGKYQQATAPMNYNSLSLLEEIIIYWNNPPQVSQF